jgi:hypothetical protein
MTYTMLAGRLDLAPRHFQVEELPIPEPAQDELTVWPCLAVQGRSQRERTDHVTAHM